MPSLTSFTNPTTYITEVPATTNKLTAAFLSGITYFAPTIDNVGATANPGNLFGWLIHARSIAPSSNVIAPGTTTDSYVYYTNPYDMITDLNVLGGLTGVLINTTGTANTYGFFIKDSTNAVKVQQPGKEFLYCFDYLAYGGNLVIAGNTAGFYKFLADSGSNIDIIFGGTGLGVTRAQKWLESEAPNTVGVFASLSDGTGTTCDTFVFSNPTFTEGATLANRVFSIYGQKTRNNLSVASLVTNGTLSYTNNLNADVAGLFTRAKSRNQLYLTIAGSSRGTILNGDLSNTVDWTNTALKNLLKTNRVNYILNYTTKFLGSDLVGATASSTEPGIGERIGPAMLKTVLNRDITQIGLKYLYEVNNETTRQLVTNEIKNYLAQYNTSLDVTGTQITCDSTNNTNNTAGLNIYVAVKPLIGTTTFTLSINLTQ